MRQTKSIPLQGIGMRFVEQNKKKKNNPNENVVNILWIQTNKKLFEMTKKTMSLTQGENALKSSRLPFKTNKI